jgi:hypothetical protein
VVGGFRLLLHGGYAVEGGEGRARYGPQLRFTLREERLVVVEALSWASGLSGGRTRALAGIGGLFPLRGRFAALVAGLGGVDVVSSGPVDVLPVVALHLGVEWARRLGPIDALDLTLAGAADIGRARAGGMRAGGTSVSLALGFGLAPAGR